MLHKHIALIPIYLACIIPIYLLAFVGYSVLTMKEEIYTYRTSYQINEGYSAGPLVSHSAWEGDASIEVTSSELGGVTNGGTGLDSQVHHTTGVLDSLPDYYFGVGDRLTINVQLQFTLGPDSLGQEIARIGFSRDSSHANLEQGFGIVWDELPSQPGQQYGFIRFFPDFNDYFPSDRGNSINRRNSMEIQGRYAGLGQYDRQSNPFDITYVVEHAGDGNWGVKTLSITDQLTEGTFFYDFQSAPAQTFQFDGQNAFLGQNLVVQGQNSSAVVATSDFISINYTGRPKVAVR